MEIHLVDATYELFRAHFAPRPPVLGRDGIPLSGVSGLVEQLLYLLREEHATHIGCATDRVIESFRNDLFPGYKSSAGMPPELLAQFPIAEAAVEALGIVLWPMVEFEADDAIAAAAVRFAEDPRVERILVCTPDKDMAQLVRGERIVLWDRRRNLTYDDAAVRSKWGVAPTSIPDYLAVVGDASDGYPGLPGWGAKSAGAVLARYGSLEAVPRQASAWEVPVHTTRPFSTMWWRSASAIRAPTFLSITRIAWPSRFSRPRQAQISWRISGARPSVASSRIRSLGLVISARPIASICCSPPESWLPRLR